MVNFLSSSEKKKLHIQQVIVHVHSLLLYSKQNRFVHFFLQMTWNLSWTSLAATAAENDMQYLSPMSIRVISERRETRRLKQKPITYNLSAISDCHQKGNIPILYSVLSRQFAYHNSILVRPQFSAIQPENILVKVQQYTTVFISYMEYRYLDTNHNLSYSKSH